MHACMHACMHVCMYVCMYVYICEYAFIYIYTYIYTYQERVTWSSSNDESLRSPNRMSQGAFKEGSWDSIQRVLKSYGFG